MEDVDRYPSPIPGANGATLPAGSYQPTKFIVANARQYLVYGLRVSSEIEVPDVPATPFSGSPDVTVHLASPLPEPPPSQRSVEVNGETVTLSWPMLGTYRIESPGRIAVHPLEDDEALDSLHLPLFGIVFGVLLHLRGYLTLHASAVSIDGNVVGFMGQKGQGKSTTALALRRAGAGFVSDDVIAALPDGDRLRVFCGPPSAKAWPASVEAIGNDPDEYRRMFPSMEKRMLTIPTIDPFQVLHLDALYVLERSAETSFERIFGTEALLAVLSNSYAQRFMGMHGATGGHLRLSTLAISSSAVFRLRARNGLSELDRLAGEIIAHVSEADPA